MKKIGFLSFGHWSDSYGSRVRSATDSLLQSIELAVAAEELGLDGAYFRVHHFARQLSSPFPLLAAIGARTRKIEIGTAVIDMRYENPLYMAEDAGAADIIAGGRLQLGISRGSPEQVIDGWRHFGYTPSIELAVAAEELGADGAYFRVHHFARQLGSPFPLLAAIGARTRTIEIGTAVIDMRYENPLYMAEDAGAADLIAGGRLQLGISRGSPEQVIDGWRYFGYAPAAGESDADMARRHAEMFLDVLKGDGFAKPNPRPMFPNPPGLLRVEPHSEGLRDRIWWGSGSNATSRWAAKLGMNLQSSTLKDDESGEPLHVQQRRQIEAYREAWKEAGHQREPRVSVSRSIFPLVDDRDRTYFGRDARDRDQVGLHRRNMRAIFGRSYAAEPDVLVKELAADEAIAAADTLLLTVPNTLGVDYNAHVIESILKYVAPALGWR